MWQYLSNVFSYNLKGSELGITNDLIFKIVNFYGGRNSNCEVYAFNDQVYENKRGADIDLFIEDNKTGNYYFYMLQSKIMNHRGKYLEIKPWSPRAQYYKLIRNAKIENALPLYLFYNGQTSKIRLNISNFGLSIVNATYIRDIVNFQRIKKINQSINYDRLAFCMSPLHILFCKPTSDFVSQGTINRNDIYLNYPYRNISSLSKEDYYYTKEYNKKNQTNRDILDTIKNRHLAPFRIIINNHKILNKI